MEQAHREYKSRRLEVLAVSIDAGEERAVATRVRDFMTEFKVTFPLWLDPEGRSQQAFGVWWHPSTILIDRGGRVVGRVRGERDWASEAARRLVEALLER